MLDAAAREAIAASQPELIEIRHDIHAHPEMGMQEFRTAALVAAKLREWGVEVAEGIGETGVVGTVRGRLPGQRAIGLRADMDALSIPEQTGLAYASANPGVMHACGHDGHTTMLLGAAKYLAAHRDFAGTVHMIFQPAEEGCGGAVAMLEDGLFERYPCDTIYGLHNQPGLAAGKFATRKGPLLAAAGTWTVVFRGTGGHGGATPHLATDVTIAQAQFVLGIQTIVSRSIAPMETAVVSVGAIHGGSFQSPNVMPAEIEIAGTMRCFNENNRGLIETRMRVLAEAAATATGCSVDVVLRWATHPLINQDEQTEVSMAAARDLVGAANVEPNWTPLTAGDDFAFMMEQRPGSFMLIGNGVAESGPTHMVHTPHYDFNDEIIPLGVEYWVSLVHQELALGGGSPSLT
jgi:amidohydrolase